MGTLARWLHGREYIQLLLNWRWLVLLIAVPLSIVIELIEGQSEGLHLLDEVFIDGMVLPVTTWVILTFAAQKMANQFKREADLERKSQFTQRLGEHREYHDLAQFIVAFPASILPVERASLFAFTSDQPRLRTIAEWGSGAFQPARRGETLAICAECGTAPAIVGAERCANCQNYGVDERQRSYNLVLMHNGKQVGLLRLHWRAGEQAGQEDLALLTSLAPEIATALSRALEDAHQAARVYREAQAYERRRLTQELHDSLAQQIFYLNLSLDQLADDPSLGDNAAVQQKLGTMRDVAADVYEQIRNNLSILRAWEQVDLTEAVSELARATTRNANLSIAIDVQGEPGWLSPHTCENLYSAVREALNNVVKHASAHHVQLAVLWSPERLTIRLSDDGHGFDTRQPIQSGHYGLTLMRETVEALRGDLEITSAPGRGTTLTISVPLDLPSPALETLPTLSQRLHNALDLIA